MALSSKSQVLNIQAFGFRDASTKLKKVSFRMRDAQPAYEQAMQLMEESEERVFASLHGKFVDTGHLKETLTQTDATDAIREAHAQGADFGTSVWYTRFHKDKKGKSPYLKLLTKERKEVGKLMVEYVVGGMGVRF